jgi:hypothetical protein
MRLLPAHAPPLAVQLVELPTVQLSVMELPVTALAALDVRVIVGGDDDKLSDAVYKPNCCVVAGIA